QTASKVIKEVKESIQAKGIEIPEGTHATRYPEYIEKMRSETDFSELEERVISVEKEVKGIKEMTVWGKQLSKSITGDMLNVGNIEFGSGRYRIGSATVRPNVLYLNQGISVGTATGVGTADQSGFYAGANGMLALMTSTEIHQANMHYHPRILFYLNNSGEATSSIREAYPGILSIPDKLCVGSTRRTDTNHKLLISGGTSQFGDHIYSNGNIFTGNNKYGSYDGLAGVSMTTTGNIHITSNESPSIRFYRSNETEATSSLIEGTESCLSVKDSLNIGDIRSTPPEHTLNVKGTGNVTEAFTAKTINGIPLTTSGNGSKFLGDDGKYHNLQLDNYLPVSGGQLKGKVYMNRHKLHLGNYDGGVSGISYDPDKGVLIESTYQGGGICNIELYTKDNGDIVLNTTNGKALYKDAEIATLNDLSEITTLRNKVAALEQLIEELTAKLS
ncbi:MAG: hypothetical protein LUE93_15330, partial [Bacteroides sp.]|nr:hypothetical protein [Bacteroides sp.]